MTEALATAGRHATNDLVIADPSVSGAHLELSRRSGSVRIRDVGSTNGTWLGPHRVVDIELAPGAEITVGQTTLRFDAAGGARPVDPSPRESFGGLVGHSIAMRELFATLERIAATELSVVVHGETGTGKEEVARAIHAASKRKERPLVVIDATSLPETLAESLLFGHERGAFTGATERREGFFEAADGGTVFIDEVGELSPALQAKFLRVLERHEIVRVGGHQPVKVDVRIVAATHRDLRNEIDGRRFRDDLYFRLAQIRVRLPPLRDRLEDLEILCQNLLAGIATDDERKVSVDAEALDHLKTLSWPGNIRELRNVLARAVALMSGDVVRRSDVAGEGDGFRGSREERTALDVAGLFADAKQRSIERFESAYLTALMRRTEGNLSRASRESGVVRHHLRELLRKRGLYQEGEPTEADTGTRH
jgi:DNA-binding NtrC family response regulator